MKIKIKKENEYTRELEIDIPWTELESDFDDAIKKFSKQVKMPGFRSGKIPRDRLLSQFQPNIEAEFMDSNFQVRTWLSANLSANLIVGSEPLRTTGSESEPSRSAASPVSSAVVITVPFASVALAGSTASGTRRVRGS